MRVERDHLLTSKSWYCSSVSALFATTRVRRPSRAMFPHWKGRGRLLCCHHPLCIFISGSQFLCPVPAGLELEWQAQTVPVYILARLVGTVLRSCVLRDCCHAIPHPMMALLFLTSENKQCTHTVGMVSQCSSRMTSIFFPTSHQTCQKWHHKP